MFTILPNWRKSIGRSSRGPSPTKLSSRTSKTGEIQTRPLWYVLMVAFLLQRLAFTSCFLADPSMLVGAVPGTQREKLSWRDSAHRRQL